MVLVTQVRGLLECLVMIDAKDARLSGRSLKDQTADFRGKISGACVSKRGVCLKAMNAGRADTPCYAIDL